MTLKCCSLSSGSVRKTKMLLLAKTVTICWIHPARFCVSSVLFCLLSGYIILCVQNFLVVERLSVQDLRCCLVPEMKGLIPGVFPRLMFPPPSHLTHDVTFAPLTGPLQLQRNPPPSLLWGKKKCSGFWEKLWSHRSGSSSLRDRQADGDVTCRCRIEHLLVK